jgi:hypothetical protein
VCASRDPRGAASVSGANIGEEANGWWAQSRIAKKERSKEMEKLLSFVGKLARAYSENLAAKWTKLGPVGSAAEEYIKNMVTDAKNSRSGTWNAPQIGFMTSAIKTNLFFHKINKGGEEEIMGTASLRPSEALIIGGGGESVRAFGVDENEAAESGKGKEGQQDSKNNILFTTTQQPRANTTAWAEWREPVKFRCARFVVNGHAYGLIWKKENGGG